MGFTEITTDNCDDFEEFLGEDICVEMERSFFRGIGAEDDSGNPVGAMIYELINSESVEDTTSRILVLAGESEEIKKGLLAEYRVRIAEDDVTESFYEFRDPALAALMKADGFSGQEEEAQDLAVTVSDIRKMADALKLKNLPPYIRSIAEISPLQYRAFVKNCLFKDHHGLLEDLAYLPKNFFETELSGCSLTDEEVHGAFLIRKMPSGKLMPLLYTAFGPDYKKDLLFMLAYCARKTPEKYPEDTIVLIRRHNDTVRNLTKKFFPEMRGDTIYTGSRKEA